MIQRCVNIDWLECYCLEDALNYPHDADYFRAQGFRVQEREYGTPVYEQMFTLFGTDDQPLIEVRRSPKSAKSKQLHGVLDPNACHVRLTNRTCYFMSPVKLMQQFLEQYGLHFQRISRLDICLDFTKFDYGDDPADIMDRYFRHKYSKINQCRIRANGRDLWDGRIWNSVAWGNEKSMIGTKFYNKSMELREKSDKPYIRQAWRAAGLVDDEVNLTKTVTGKDGKPVTTKPDVWRVEFSIKSSTRKWFIIEDESGAKRKIRSIQHTLDMYYTRDDLLSMFFSLAEHYFHFKKFKAATRKDRCEDKLLFKVNERAIHYKLENIATKEAPSHVLNSLYHLIENYRETHVESEVYKACNVLLQKIEEERHTTSWAHPWPLDELTALRLVIARRINNPNLAASLSLADTQAIIKAADGLFGEK